MGSTRTRGITLESDGSRTVNKVWKGNRIFARLGQVSQEAAEEWLRAEIERLGAQRHCQRSAGPLFADGAARFLIESSGKRSVEMIAWHIKLLLPFVGSLPLDRIHDGTLRPFVDARLAGTVEVDGGKLGPTSATTVNRSLEVVRSILNRAARAWRDDNGRPLLSIAPPLITMLTETPRKPYPISWDEQDRLMKHLAAHLQRPVLFALNTGLRDNNVCGLKWQWEQRIRELNRSVFIIPASEFKTGVPHVVVLNDTAWSIVEAQRKKHKVWVFPHTIVRGGDELTNRLDSMNNNGFQNARKKAGLQQMRVHDLRHTFATRLRLAGVAQEDRNALMGHGGCSMPEHYASADIGRLIELANRASERHESCTILRVVNG